MACPEAYYICIMSNHDLRKCSVRLKVVWLLHPRKGLAPGPCLVLHFVGSDSVSPISLGPVDINHIWFMVKKGSDTDFVSPKKHPPSTPQLWKSILTHLRPHDPELDQSLYFTPLASLTNEPLIQI